MTKTARTQYWLMKSEPDELSIADLAERKCWHWDGVRNYEARNFMRDKMRIGDKVLFYHSSVPPLGVVGIARVASLPYPDHTQFDKRSKYFDPKATKEKPIWHMVDVSFEKMFSAKITRDALQKIPGFKNALLWKRPRLSIVPLTKEEFDAVLAHAKQK